MTRVHTLPGISCGLFVALLSTAGFAEPMSSTIGANYERASAPGAGSTDSWEINASGSMPLDWSGVSIAGGAAFWTSSHSSGGNVNNLELNVAPYWSGANGRVGATFNYLYADGAGPSASTFIYGAGGEWFAGEQFTVGVRGGGFANDLAGSYLGAEVKWYAMPDFSVMGGYDHTSLDFGAHENDWTAAAEYLFSEETPIAGYLQYQRGKLTVGGLGSLNIDAWTIGIKYYCNPTAKTLVDRQRTGTFDYVSNVSAVGFKF
jgi:hypothetical protein